MKKNLSTKIVKFLNSIESDDLNLKDVSKLNTIAREALGTCFFGLVEGKPTVINVTCTVSIEEIDSLPQTDDERESWLNVLR